MPDAAVAIDRLEALKVTLHFPPQIAFDRNLVVRDGVDDLVDLLRAEVFRPQVGVDVGLFENAFRGRGADSVNVGE